MTVQCDSCRGLARNRHGKSGAKVEKAFLVKGRVFDYNFSYFAFELGVKERAELSCMTARV